LEDASRGKNMFRDDEPNDNEMQRRAMMLAVQKLKQMQGGALDQVPPQQPPAQPMQPGMPMGQPGQQDMMLPMPEGTMVGEDDVPEDDEEVQNLMGMDQEEMDDPGMPEDDQMPEDMEEEDEKKKK
jgi:hypothetical protein